MQFCENILKHLMLQQEMGKAHVPDSLLKDYEEEELLELSQNINEMDAGSLVAECGTRDSCRAWFCCPRRNRMMRGEPAAY